MVRDHTHTQRGFWLISKGSKWLQAWAWKWGKGLPGNKPTSTHEGLHKGPKPRTRPQSKTQLTSMTNIRLKQTMQGSDWPTISPFVIDDNWLQAPPQGELPLTRISLPLWHQWQRVAGCWRVWLRKLKLMKVVADKDGSWRRVVDEDDGPSINQWIC